MSQQPKALNWVRAHVDHLRAACEWGLADEFLKLVTMSARRRRAVFVDPEQIKKLQPLIDDGVILVCESGELIPEMVQESLAYSGKQAETAKNKVPKIAAPEPTVEPARPAPPAEKKVKKSGLEELPEWVPPEEFAHFIQHRKDIKRPMTDRAIKLSVNELEKLSSKNTALAAEILNQTISNGWLGLFAIKVQWTGGKSQAPAMSGGFNRTQAEDILTYRGQ